MKPYSNIYGTGHKLLTFFSNCRVEFLENAAWQNVDFLQPTTDR